MKKTRLVIFSLLVFLLGAIAIIGLNKIPMKAAGENIGAFAPDTAPAWINGDEVGIKEKFQTAYNEAGFTAEPTELVQSIELSKARVVLYQDIPGEGKIYLNATEGKALAVTDLNAVSVLDQMMAREGETKKGILLNIIKKEGETFYVTDAWKDTAIFKMVEDSENPGTFVPNYLDFKIGVGENTFEDIQWMDFTRAYQLAVAAGIEIGLPERESTLGYYVTPDVDAKGRIRKDGERVITSKKQNVVQTFANGYIMHAAMRELNNEGNMIWPGHLPIQHPAAVILKDVYEKVKALSGNDQFNVTGMPISHEITKDGVRYQNFEFGYIKLVGEEISFVEGKVVDDLATEMPRQATTFPHFDKMRGNADNFNGAYKLCWQRARLARNLRNRIGQLIRDGYLREEDLAKQGRNAENAPVNGVWTTYDTAFVANTGQAAPGLGGSAMFIYQTYWYKPSYALYPKLNVPLYVDAKAGAGKPIDNFVPVYDGAYQKFVECIAVINNKGEITQVKYEDLTTWLDGAETIEEAMLAKGLVESQHTVSFVGHEGADLGTAEVPHGKALTAEQIPTPPAVEGFQFDQWEPAIDQNIYLPGKVFTAKYNALLLTVTFVNLNDEVIKTQEVNLGEDATAPEASLIPTIEHYEFKGWDKEFTNVRENLTVKTVYEPIEYEINYNLPAEAANPDNPATYNVESEIELKPAKLAGNKFAGWFTDAELTTPIERIAAGTSGLLSIYPKFEEVNLEDFLGKFEGAAPAWILGQTELVKTKFTEAYNEAGFTEIPTEFIKVIEKSKARVMLYQNIGTEGRIYLDSINRKPMVVKDPLAIQTLDEYDRHAANHASGLLLNVVEVHGETCYLVDSYKETPSFKVIDDPENPGSKKVSNIDLYVGKPTNGYYGYWDILWSDNAKAYQIALEYGVDIGFVLEVQKPVDYNTPNVLSNGQYEVDGNGNQIKSIKKYAIQKFTGGYLIQSPLRIIANLEENKMGGHQPTQMPGAAVLNDMFDLLKAIEGNINFEVTGVPISPEWKIEGVRYQNVEFGYVKLVDGALQFVKDKYLDDKGTEMPHYMGRMAHFDNWRMGSGENMDGKYKICFHRPFVHRNRLNEVGRLIREGYLTEDLMKKQRFAHTAAGGGGAWTTIEPFEFPEGEIAPSLGGNSLFITQKYWYMPTYTLLPYLNVNTVEGEGVGRYVDADASVGVMVDNFHMVYNAGYQKFEKGYAISDGINAPFFVTNENLETWLDGAASIDAALVAKGLAQSEHTVKFVVKEEVEGVEQDKVIKEITVPHGQKVPADQLPSQEELQIPEGQVFGGWDRQDKPVNLPERIYRPIFGQAEVTVTFVDYDGTVLKEETITYGSDAVAPDNPVRTDYEFIGWDPAELTNITENTTFTAQYKATVAFVKFIDHNGVLIGEEQRVEFGHDAVAPTPPEREHYAFSKWDKEFTNVQADLTVQAIYTPIEYTITYHLGEGETNHLDNPSKYTVETETITLKPASKDGKMFEGWFTDEALTLKLEKIEKGTGKNIDLYPKFGELPEHELLIGRIAEGQEPTWITGRYDELEENIRKSYLEYGLEGLAQNFMVSVDLGQARVMLYQVFGEAEMLVVNELNLKPFVVKGKLLVNYVKEHQEEIVLGVTKVAEVTYLVTDRAIVYVEGEEVKTLDYKLGVSQAPIHEKVDAIMLNDFGKAYKQAGFDLGIPEGAAEVKKYNTYDISNENSKYQGWRLGVYKLDEEGNKVRSEKSYFVQKFTNGYIIMGRQGIDAKDDSRFLFGAAPITNEMYGLVTALEGNGTLQETGAPVSVELHHEDKIYQNFEFGYVKVEAGVATFVVDLVVDSQGTEMNRRIGSSEHVANWLIGEQNAQVFFQAYERLRVGQNFREAMGKALRAGATPYESDADIHWAPHENGGYGIIHIFLKGNGTGVLWGGKFVLYQGAWYRPAFDNAPALNAYIVSGRITNGLPIDDWKRLYNVEYQLLENGLAYVADGEAPAFVDLETLQGHLAEHTTIDAWLVAAGIALEPSEDGNPEQGTVKFVNFDVVEDTGKFWYEDETHVINVSNSLLYNAWRETAPNVAQAIQKNGAPLYADDTNFITDKHWYYIEDGAVKVKDTFGVLPESVTSLKTGDKTLSMDESKQVVISKEFGNAFILSWDRSGHFLGLPTGPVEIQKEILDPDQPDLYIDVIVQKFEHGWIVQEAYEGTAFPIYGEILDLWQKDLETENGGGGVQELGVPMSRQFKVGEVYYQNFKYGYMKLENGQAEVKFDVSDLRHIDFNGDPVHYRFARYENRANAAVAHSDYMYESARFYEAYMKAYSDYKLKRKAENYQFGELLEVAGAHEWNGWGMTQGFVMGSSTANCWGQTQFVIILQESPYLPAHVVSSGILMQYSDAAGNQGSFKFPLDDDFDIEVTVSHEDEEITFKVTYQNFDNSYIRAYTIHGIEITEYFQGYRISRDGKHINIETNEEEPIPEWKLDALDQPEVSKEELVAKLDELKAKRATVLPLEGNLKDLPSNKLYAPKEDLAEIDATIKRIEELLAKETITPEEIEEALVDVQLAQVKINSRAQAGQGNPVEDGQDTPSKGLSGGAKAGISIAVIVVVAAIIGVVVLVLLKKKRK